jgi:hypothetical protein
LETGIETPDQVRAYERRSDDVRILFLLNFGEDKATVQLEEVWTDLFAGDQTQAVTLEPAGVCVLERPIQSYSRSCQSGSSRSGSARSRHLTVRRDNREQTTTQ